MKNTGQAAQDEFEAHYDAVGKRAYVYRVTDSAEVRGMFGKGATKPQPCDYIVTHDGETFYAEVKSTVDPVAFTRSKLRSNQIGAARRVVTAGGKYFVFIKSLALSYWYRVPADVIYDAPKGTFTWMELEPYRCAM